MAYNSPRASVDGQTVTDTYNLTNSNEYPVQTVSWSTKQTLPWKKKNMDFFTRVWNEESARRLQKVVNYRLINGEYSFNQYNNLQGLGVNPGSLGEIPREITHFPICVIPLQSLWGEEVQRPFNFRAKNEDEGATNEYLRTKTELVHQNLNQEIQREIQQKVFTLGIDINSEEGQQAAQSMTPPEIEKYMQRDFSTVDEDTANAILRKYIKKLNVKETFNKGWVDATIVAEEIYWIGTVNGETVLECVNPVNFVGDKSYDLFYLDEGEFGIRGELMSHSNIIDRYREFLTEDEIERIDRNDVYDSNPALNAQTSMVDFGDFSFIPYNENSESYRYPLVSSGLPGVFDPITEYLNSGYGNGGRGSNRFKKHILVLHAEWMSKRKICTLHFFDEEGEPDTIYLDGEFELDKEMKDNGWTAEYTWINEAWEGTKIGDKIYCKIQPKNFQFKSSNKLYGAKLGYTGGYYNNRNTTPTSPLDQMKPYNELYNIISDKIRSYINSDIGYLIPFDLAQIPSKAGWDFEKWKKFYEEEHMLLIDSNQEGGKFWNTFNVLQTSTLAYIDKCMSLLEYLQAECARIVGFSPQRLGDVKATETATATNAALSKSYAQTEYNFKTHNNIKGRVLTNLLEQIKFNLEEGYEDTYFLNDLSIAFLKVSTGFKFSDTCVYVTDSAKDAEILNIAKQMIQPVLQNGGSMLGAFTLASEESIAVIREKLEEIDVNRQKMEEAKLQNEQMAIQSSERLEMERMDREDANKQLDRESNERIAESKILSSAAFGTKDIDLDDNSVPDIYEMSKIGLEQSKQRFEQLKSGEEMKESKAQRSQDKSLKEKELAIKIKDSKQKLEIEDKKLRQVEVQNKNQEKLQNEELKFKREEIKFKRDELKLKKEVEIIKASAAKAKARQSAKPKPKSK